MDRKKICGIIMPISSMDGYPKEHWKDLLKILTKEIENSTDFKLNIVSSSNHSGIIQRAIINNLYENEIVLADVSGKNPNVMFELGIRLAFDKPTIVIKDEKTDYSFDTSPIEHLIYPSSLNAVGIETFCQDLIGKIQNTYKKSITNKNYSTFLKHFGHFKISEIEDSYVSMSKYLQLMQNQLSILTNYSIDQEIVFESNNIVKGSQSELDELRRRAELLDIELLKTLSKRMENVFKIGRFKKENHVTSFQLGRFQQLMKYRVSNGELVNLNEEFVFNLFQLIHEESVRIQTEILDE